MNKNWTLREVFHYQRVHYILYMLEDFQVHYHVLPRYDSEPMFEGQAFVDEAWPGYTKNTNPGEIHIGSAAPNREGAMKVVELFKEAGHALEGTYSYEYRLK